MRNTIFILLVSLTLVSCGISYSVPRATLHADVADNSQFVELREQISEFLINSGFKDLGIDEKMLKLNLRSSKQHQAKTEVALNAHSDEVNRIYRTGRFKQDALNIDVVIIDYSDPAIKNRFVNYPTSESAISDAPTLELNIYNYRPGGFSVEAFEFYEELISFIDVNHNAPVKIIFSPPKQNQIEFYKVKTINFIAGVFWWAVVFTISIALFGGAMIKILNRTNLPVTLKRSMFSFFGVIFATPLPFPAATVFVVILPSVFSLPSIGTDYFVRIQDFALPSIIISAILCILLSVLYIKAIDLKTHK